MAYGLAYYYEGYSAELIALELPTLSLEEVYGALTCYLHNRPAVDPYLVRRAAQLQAITEQHPHFRLSSPRFTRGFEEVLFPV